jgi:hypothetical protein
MRRSLTSSEDIVITSLDHIVSSGRTITNRKNVHFVALFYCIEVCSWQESGDIEERYILKKGDFASQLRNSVGSIFLNSKSFISFNFGIVAPCKL